MADSADIDAAIVAVLQADGALAALMPGGVYWDGAQPAGVTQFVKVSLVDSTDEDAYEGRAFEAPLYLVQAVERSTVAVKNIKAAAARIDVLLGRGSFAATGYAAITTRRESYVRPPVDIDAVDETIRFWQRGGRYVAMASV